MAPPSWRRTPPPSRIACNLPRVRRPAHNRHAPPPRREARSRPARCALCNDAAPLPGAARPPRRRRGEVTVATFRTPGFADGFGASSPSFLPQRLSPCFSLALDSPSRGFLLLMPSWRHRSFAFFSALTALALRSRAAAAAARLRALLLRFGWASSAQCLGGAGRAPPSCASSSAACPCPASVAQDLEAARRPLPVALAAARGAARATPPPRGGDLVLPRTRRRRRRLAVFAHARRRARARAAWSNAPLDPLQQSTA